VVHKRNVKIDSNSQRSNFAC